MEGGKDGGREGDKTYSDDKTNTQHYSNKFEKKKHCGSFNIET